MPAKCHAIGRAGVPPCSLPEMPKNAPIGELAGGQFADWARFRHILHSLKVGAQRASLVSRVLGRRGGGGGGVGG